MTGKLRNVAYNYVLPQTESCTLAQRQTSWAGTLPFSERWGIIIQSEQSSMTPGG